MQSVSLSDNYLGVFPTDSDSDPDSDRDLIGYPYPKNRYASVRGCIGGGTTLSNRLSRINPVDVALFLSALRLARRAQRVRRVPIPDVVEDIAARGGGGRDYPVQRVELAAARAANRWRRWFGGLDTCLIRSLVLGGLLSGRGEVMLNIGFRPGDEQPSVDGHAWATVDGNPVGVDGDLARERYTRVLTVPFVRGSGEK